MSKTASGSPTPTGNLVGLQWDDPRHGTTVGAQDRAWGEVADLSRLARVDPAAAARELERRFRSGRASTGLDGPADLRLVCTMLGRPIDRLVAAYDDRYRPWVAKTFNAAEHTGGNWLSARSRHVTRVALAPAKLALSGGVVHGLPFTTSTVASAVYPDVSVLRIDYAGSRRNPPLMRKLTQDELVEIGPGVHLGLVHVPGRHGRRVPAGYFALRARQHAGT